MFKKTVFLLLVLCLSAVSMVADGRKYTLVIDAGHGGKDPGALGAFSKEKDINLNVALAFGRYVEQHCPDVNVVYTRKTDVFVELLERAAIANRAKADVFVSIHTNSNTSKSIMGFQTYTLGLSQEATNLDVAKRENSVMMLETDYLQRYESYDPNSAESTIMFEVMQNKNMENSVKLAQFVQKSATAISGRRDKGVHQANLCVLRETSMPGCLIELGFISAPEEERSLNEPYMQDQLARAIYQAFVQYKDKTSGLRHTGRVDVPPVVAPAEIATAAPEPQPETPEEPAAPAAPETLSKPVFKVQIMSGTDQLKDNDPRLGGLTGVESIQDGRLIRYTYGSSTDYNAIYRIRESIKDKFPDAFIVAFRDGQKMNVGEAIAEWKKNNN